MALSNLGLITMGGAMLRPGGSLGDGFLGYGQGLAQDSRMKVQAAQTQAYLQQADMERQQFEAKQRAAKEQQDNWKAFLGTFGPQTPAQASQAPAGSLNGPLGSGTFGIDPLAAMGQKSAPQQGPKWTDMRMLLGLRAGLKREDIEAIANAQNLGLPEVARTIKGRNPDGTPVETQYDKQGRVIGAPIAQPFELRSENLDGVQQNVNPYTGGDVGAPKARVPFEYQSNGAGDYQMRPGVLAAKAKVAAAGAPNLTVNAGKDLASQVGDMMKAESAGVSGAIALADSAGSLEEALNSGKVMAGPGTSFRVAGLQLGQVMGITGKTTDEVLTKTRQAIRALAQMDVQARKQLQGQGQVTESEGKAVAKAEGGNIDDMTIPELRLLVGLSKKVANLKATQYSAKLQSVPAELRPFYQVPGLERYVGEQPQASPSPSPPPAKASGLPAAEDIAAELARRRSGGR